MDAPSHLPQVLSGEAVWPSPMWLTRHAGRNLREYRVVGSKAKDFITLCTTPELATDVTL